MNRVSIYTFVFVLITILGLQTSSAQTQVQLDITHMLGGTSPFVKGNETVNDLGDRFTVTRLEYYISKISIIHDGGTVTDVPDHYILVNGETAVKEDLGSFNITNVEGISFHVGVDTPNNHNDPSSFPSGHPLEPKSPSMHWGWAAGYRFSAIEGNTGPAFDQEFQVHSLGDNNYLKTTVVTGGVMQGGKITIPIYADYAQILRGIDVTPSLVEHGNATLDVKVMNNFKDHVFKPGHPVSVSQAAIMQDNISIAPNPSANGDFTISFADSKSAEIVITNIQGSIVKNILKNSATVNVHLDVPGLYIVKTTFSDGNTAISKLQVQ